MPTIAEIIAAKKAAAGNPAAKREAYADSYAPRETIAERIDLKDAIDRIDPPGKSQRATAARKSAGIILNMELPPAPKDHRLEVPQEITQPADDQPLCIWVDKGTLWLCMPCAVASMPPIKVLRLPWSVWPAPAPQPLPEGEPF
jgi:hypothetical protein